MDTTLRSRHIDWEDVTIRDNYMFATVFRDPGLCKELLQIVLEVPIDKVVLLENEATRMPEIGAKGIRMDVYVADDSGTVYDVEMQNANEGDLARRSRYYLSANDMDCIAPGVGYDEMRDSFVVFVCSFDPFGRNLPRYYVTPHCKEDGIEMPDGSARVFLNALAWEKCADQRLSGFLHYLNVGTIGGDDFTQRVDEAVRLARQRPEWRHNRMKLERYLEEQRIKATREGRAKGLAEGRAKGRAEGREQERIALAQLSTKLAEAGRQDELAAALADKNLLDHLLAEFGLIPSKD